MSLPGNAASPPPDDRLVASAMRAAAAVPPGDCPDAEVLGLYAERALDDDAERVAVNTHVTGCARCQAIVADYVRAVPALAEGHSGAMPASVVGWLSGWRWLVPLASAAAVGVVAVWIGRGPSDQTAERAATGSAAAEYDASVAARGAQPPSDSPVPPAAALPELAGLARQRAGGARAGATASKAVVPSTPSATLADATSNRESRERRDATIEAEATVPPASAVAGLTERAAEPMAAAPPPASAAAPAETPAGGAPSDAARSKAELSGRTERASDSAFRAAADPARWRVREGRVERSGDGGSTWVRVELPTTDTIATVTVRDDGTVVATSSTGRVWTSRDSGESWTPTP